MLSLPVTIISGYLGSGKTTLINRLLAEDHGLRLMVIVNDFGAINIDAHLIDKGDDDMIALTNGCVCCTMGADLNAALDTALSRTPRPDHVIIETSGIADPSSIANAVIDAPGLGYGGIVTLVDGDNALDLLADPDVAEHVDAQIATADLVLVSKTDSLDAALMDQLVARGARQPAPIGDAPLADLLLDLLPLPRGRAVAPHPAYASWQHDSDTILDRAALGDRIAARPDGLYRLKGFVRTNDGGYEIHIVGRHVKARRCPTDRTTLVALGPASRISRDEIDRWWQGAS